MGNKRDKSLWEEGNRNRGNLSLFGWLNVSVREQREEKKRRVF